MVYLKELTSRIYKKVRFRVSHEFHWLLECLSPNCKYYPDFLCRIGKLMGSWVNTRLAAGSIHPCRLTIFISPSSCSIVDCSISNGWTFTVSCKSFLGLASSVSRSGTSVLDKRVPSAGKFFSTTQMPRHFDEKIVFLNFLLNQMATFISTLPAQFLIQLNFYIRFCSFPSL